MIDFHTEQRQAFLRHIQGKPTPTAKEFGWDCLAVILGGLLLIVILFL